MSDRIPAELYPPIDFVREEMEAREWSDEHLIAQSGAIDPVDVLTIELFLAIDPREMDCPVIMGDRLAEMLGNAFGVSASFWTKLDENYRAWREHQ